MRRTVYALAGSVCLLLASAQAVAQDAAAPTLKPLAVAQVEGTYAGTFLCGVGEMGMTLTLQDEGLTDDADKRNVSGALNFFPTVGNPSAPKGAFRVSGTVDYSMDFLQRLDLKPGDWLDQPKNFGASPMTGVIYEGEINGKPTASGCHSLYMRKIIFPGAYENKE